MDKNACWTHVKTIFNQLQEEEEEAEENRVMDKASSFNLTSTMIKSFPPLLADRESSSRTSLRTLAFGAFLLSQSLKYQCIHAVLDKELLLLQETFFDILLVTDKKRWRLFCEALIKLSTRLAIIFSNRSKCSSSSGQTVPSETVTHIFTRKELESVGREEGGGCRLIDDLSPEDDLFPNRDLVIGISDTGSLRQLMFCVNRIILHNIKDICDNLHQPEFALRKVAILQIEFADLELTTQSLQLLTQIIRPQENNIKLVSLEIEIFFYFFKQVISSSFSPASQQALTSIIFKYLSKRTSCSLDDKVMKKLFGKFLKPMTEFLGSTAFEASDQKTQTIIVEMANRMLKSEEARLEEDKAQTLLFENLLNHQDLLVHQVWQELKDCTPPLQRDSSDNRTVTKGIEQQKQQHFNLVTQSSTWSTTHERLKQQVTSTHNPQEQLALTRVVLGSGRKLLKLCLESWGSQLSCLVLDKGTVARFVNIVLSTLETKTGFYDELFKGIDDLIVITHAARNCVDFVPYLNVLAGILSIPWLIKEARTLDLKDGKFGDRLRALQVGLSGEHENGFMQKSLEPLSLLPNDVCPKWRTSVFKKVPAEFSTRYVPNLNAIIGSSTLSLASELIARLDRHTSPRLAKEIAANSGLIICGMSRGLKMSLSVGNTTVWLQPTCSKCQHGQQGHHRAVPVKDLEPLFKLVGHQEPQVREELLSMIIPFSSHSSLTNSAALLLMAYLEEPELKTRVTFAKLIKYLIECDCDTLEGRDQVSNSMINRLVELEPGQRCDQGVEVEEEQWLSYLQALVSVQQCLLPQQSQIKVLNLLLELFFSTKSHLFSFVHSLDVLQDQLRKEKTYIMGWVAKKMCSGKEAQPEYVLAYLKLLVPAAEADAFINCNLHHLVPPVFFHSAQKDLKKPLTTLAAVRGFRPKALIDECFPKIYSYIVINSEDKKMFDRSIQFLERETGIKLEVFINSYRLKVIEELLCVMSCKKVICALEVCADTPDNKLASSTKPAHQKQQEHSGDGSHVKAYLSANLMAALSFFLAKLNNEMTNTETKLNSLSSMADLCRFLGPDHLSPVKHSLLACLKKSANLARKSAKYYSVSVNFWEAFVKNISLADLEVILPQVLVGLSYHATFDRETIIPLFQYLLVKNRSKLKNLMKCMVLLPDMPELQPMIKQIRGNSVELRSLLEELLEHVDHEAVEVRHQALTRLRTVLDTNMGALQGLLLRSDQIDSKVTELIQKLMNGMSSREPEEDLRFLAAECIGKIGAVDPGKLDFANSQQGTDTAESRNFLLDVSSEEFCTRLIMELVRACQSSREPFIVDITMYCIQNVLKIYKVNNDTRNLFSSRVFGRLSDTAREIVTPLMKSNFEHKPKPQASISVPVYGTDCGRSYKDWLVNFSQCLVQQIYEPKIKDIFTSCVPVLKKDVRTAEFLLPHILVSVLCGAGEEGANTILTEIMTILTGADKTKENGDVCFVEGNTGTLVAHALFSTLDHLKSWLRAKYNVTISSLGKSGNQIKVEEMQRALSERHYQAVKKFLDRIPNDLLANLSFKTESYHRSAFYLDQTLANRTEALSESELNAMQKLYACLEDADFVVGVAAIRREEPSLDSQILYNQSVGNFQDALCCFERQDNQETDFCGLIQCYLNINQPSGASVLAAGLVSKDPQLAQDLAAYQAEAAWQLGEWSDLNEFTKQETSTDSWEMNLSRVILAAYKTDKFLFQSEARKARKDVLKTLSAISSEQSAYRKCYQHIGRLAMIREVECIAERLLLNKQVDSDSLSDTLASIITELDARLSYTQVSWTNLEPILRLRRGILNAVYDRHKIHQPKVGARIKSQIGEYWLKSAQVARKAGQLQESYSFLLEAEKYENRKIFLESAKLKWERGAKTEAIAALEKGLNETFPEVMSALQAKDADLLQGVLSSLEDRGHAGHKQLCANAMLLLTRYVEEAASVGQEGIRKHYEQAKEILKTSDEIFYHQAKFYDKASMKMSPDQVINQSEIIMHAALTYLRSLRYGPTFLDECMPRLLTIWLDFGAIIQEALSSKVKRDTASIQALNHAVNQLTKLNQTIDRTMSKVPTYYFLTAFPQIVSRICHPNLETYKVLKSLMVMVFVKFPQQVAWHLVCVSKNADPLRSSRGKEVFQEAKASKPAFKKFIDDAVHFSSKIDQLCDVKTSNDSQLTTFSDILPSFPLIFKEPGFSKLILPIERNMNVTMPTSQADLETHNPFPGGIITIQGIENDIQVMVSLVRPKKITLRGSDGKLYSFLAKPKDDLRRDCRLMDMGNLLNRMFRKEPESRKRGLQMRTYTVVPTNETNGLIEWVSNLKGMRYIIIDLLKERGVLLNQVQRRYFPRPEDTKERKRECLRKAIEDMKGKCTSSLVFREWFVRTFPDPQAWYAARLAFTRTTAVMSMIGYILGLGDRHLENINVDTTTGQSFHVDMNSLFNISETYKVPEIVPFRLTGNVVDGFGPLGIEGPYRISCEVALRIMRTQKDLLMSVLRPFIFDPLVDWTVRDKSKKKDGVKEEGNKPGKEALGRVQDRLDGCVVTDRKRKGLMNPPLSVEGQVDHLINQAMDIDNLAAMYWGWSPFL